uniref:Solute carrier organic anion transporter family member n=1 Tax=Cacopsylla melanoneura TaxID=428564 RepID=A0A8D8R1L5_9HEMI
MEKDKTASETTCGLLTFKPAWLQKYATSKHFLVVYGLLGTIQAMSFVYFIATLTTIERRFKITSRTTGLMLSGNEVSQIMLALVLSYYGGQRNRPRWIAWGVACSSVSCFIVALPHFIFGPGEDALALTTEYLDHNKLYGHNETLTKEPICIPGARVPKCEHETFNIIPPILIFISQFVLGVGTTLYFSLGQTYLDDNTKKRNTPKLLGFSLALRTMGPALGFLIGSMCLRIYIDPSLHPVIAHNDPRWLGAWWLGWLALGSVMMLFAFLISMFPKKLPTRQKKNTPQLSGKENGALTLDIIDEKPVKVNENGTNNNGDLTVKPKTVEAKATDLIELKDFPQALKKLLMNRLLMTNIWSGVFYILGGSGYITYLTKYIEVQFHQSAANASIITGPAAILSMCLGFLVSGHVISKFKPGPKYLLGWNVIVGSFMVMGQLVSIFISCEDTAFQGYDPETSRMEFVNECNINCGCETLKYSPVCHQATQVTFYSACHAGCRSSKSINAVTREYTNCSCVSTGLLYQSDVTPKINILGGGMFEYQVPEDSVVTSGTCASQCGHSFMLWIGIMCVLHALTSSGKIGNILVNYRAVSPEEKSFAQGMSLLMVSLFAFIPGPILFGMIIDSTCMIWDNSCGTKGNCKLYDKENFRFKINALGACITVLGVLLDSFVCYWGRHLNLYDEEETVAMSLSSEEKKSTEKKETI